MSRNRILLLTAIADIVGAVVIFGMLPIGWTTSLIAFAIYGVVVYFASRSFLDR